MGNNKGIFEQITENKITTTVITKELFLEMVKGFITDDIIQENIMKEEIKNENKYIVGYGLSNDKTGLISFLLIADPLFNEKGKYSLEEAEHVVEFIHNYKLPELNMDNWEEFTEKLNKEIFDLYGK